MMSFLFFTAHVLDHNFCLLTASWFIVFTLYTRVILIRSGRSNGKGGVAVRGSAMPLYFPVIICTVFLSCLSYPDAVIGSVFARVIIRTVVLIFTGRSDMVCAFPDLYCLPLLPLPRGILLRAFSSFPFGITCYCYSSSSVHTSLPTSCAFSPPDDFLIRLVQTL